MRRTVLWTCFKYIAVKQKDSVHLNAQDMTAFNLILKSKMTIPTALRKNEIIIYYLSIYLYILIKK